MPSTTVSRPRSNQSHRPQQDIQTQPPLHDIIELGPAALAEEQREKDYLARERETQHAEHDRDFAQWKADMERSATYREVDDHLANRTLLRRGRYYLPHERHNPSLERSVAKRETENLYRRAEDYLKSRDLANRSALFTEHQNRSAPPSSATPLDSRSLQLHHTSPTLDRHHEVWEDHAHLLNPTTTTQDQFQRPQNLPPQTNTQLRSTSVDVRGLQQHIYFQNQSPNQNPDNYPPPTSAHEVRAFLGMTDYYSERIPNYSAISAPLVALASGAVEFSWTDHHQRAFEILKIPIIATNQYYRESQYPNLESNNIPNGNTSSNHQPVYSQPLLYQQPPLTTNNLTNPQHIHDQPPTRNNLFTPPTNTTVYNPAPTTPFNNYGLDGQTSYITSNSRLRHLHLQVLRRLQPIYIHINLRYTIINNLP